MSGEFVDPVAALIAREASSVGVIERGVAIALQAAAENRLEDAKTADARHASNVRIWIDKVRAIVTPTITSYTFTQEQLDAIHEAHEVVVDSKQAQAQAWRLRKTLGESRRGIKAFYLGLRRPFNAITAAISTLEERDAVPIDEAEAALGPKIIAYEKAAAEAERKEQARLQAIEDEKEKERVREAAAALSRVAAAEVDPGVKAALTNEAKAIERTAASATAATVQVESQRAKVKGTGTTERHTGELLNKMEFVKAVAAGRIPLDALDIKQSWIDGKAVELKEQLGVVYKFLKYVKKEGTRG